LSSSQNTNQKGKQHSHDSKAKEKNSEWHKKLPEKATQGL
jgi:hypothetical protein